MTCVIGLVHQDKVYIGGDTLGSSSVRRSVRKDDKVFQIDDMLFGFAASYRAGQAMRYFFSKPKHAAKTTVDEYVHRAVIPAMRLVLSEAGIQHKKEEVEQSCGQFMLGYQNRLFTIDYDYQVGEAACGYDAIGSGASVALGSMHATQFILEDPVARITGALEAASEHARGVGGPYSYGVV